MTTNVFIHKLFRSRFLEEKILGVPKYLEGTELERELHLEGKIQKLSGKKTLIEQLEEMD